MNKITKFLERHKIWKDKYNKLQEEEPKIKTIYLYPTTWVDISLKEKEFYFVNNSDCQGLFNICVSFRKGKLLYEYLKELYEENNNE